MGMTAALLARLLVGALLLASLFYVFDLIRRNARRWMAEFSCRRKRCTYYLRYLTDGGPTPLRHKDFHMFEKHVEDLARRAAQYPDNHHYLKETLRAYSQILRDGQ